MLFVDSLTSRVFICLNVMLYVNVYGVVSFWNKKIGMYKYVVWSVDLLLRLAKLFKK